jgi:hypothetical protein
VEATGRKRVIIAAVTNVTCLSFRSLDVRGMPPRSSAPPGPHPDRLLVTRLLIGPGADRSRPGARNAVSRACRYGPECVSRFVQGRD